MGFLDDLKKGADNLGNKLNDSFSGQSGPTQSQAEPLLRDLGALTFLDQTGEATFHALNFDERVFLLTRGRIQPHVLLGGSIPWMTIKDGSFLDHNVGDGSFRGFGLNTEAADERDRTG